ncbi:MAG: FAD-binding monooxygenase [Rhizobiaceae bacterium]
MQFHLNGFRPGDPDIKPAAAGSGSTKDHLPDKVDVLIIGCGPAGLTLAAYLAGFPDITTRIVERKPGPMEKGQADGVSCRSMEMFTAFGIAEKVKREAYWVNETTFWNPDPGSPDKIHRTGRVQDVEEGLSEMPHVILNQARIHDRYLEVMRNAPSRLEPNYSRQFVALTTSDNEYPVSVTLQRTGPAHEGHRQTVHARYVVGCDGARSAVRGAIGRELKGDRANQAWGVMDILVVTDFPDIRLKSLIKSTDAGNIILIPREGGHLVRVYIELDALTKGQQITPKDITVDHLIAAAQRVFNPYSIDVKQVAWWSVYEVGHAITDKFDNVSAESVGSQVPCVFIAGDACHTHSAKAGQGMNVSMGDAFNLGWKLVSVLQGRSAPDLLHSYSAERQKVAQDLIDFDHEWSRIIGARASGEEEQTDTPKFQRYFIEHGRFTAGLSVKYTESTLTGTATWQLLATGFEIGTRFHSAPVICLADAKPIQLGHTVTADASWRLFAFSGSGDNGCGDNSKIAQLCRFLGEDANSPRLRYTPDGAEPDSIIDVIAIFQQPHQDLDYSAMPALLKPKKGRLRLTDYEKIYSADHRQGDIFDMRGINREQGCMVIVRPDQHIAHVLPLDGFEALAMFCNGIFKATT